MSKKKNSATAIQNGLSDADSLDYLIAEVLVESAVPDWVDDSESDCVDVELSEADRQALASLGTSEEFVSRLVAEFTAELHAADLANTAPDASTRPRMESCEETQPSVTPPVIDSQVDLNALHQQLAANEAPGKLHWECDYRIKRQIGRGGQGTVHLLESLEDPDLPKALKIFSPMPYGSAESYYADMGRMKRVASQLYKMDVDNLVHVEKTQRRGVIFEMIMRWIDGCDLTTLLQPNLLDSVSRYVTEDRWRHLTNVVVTRIDGMPQSCLQPGMAANIVEKCLRALDNLHRHGIVHGDIKPSNIMLDQYGSIRVVDIGSAFEISDPPRRYTWTPRYAPPEIFHGERWTPQSDLASLGYVLIELLSGRPAVPGPDIESHSTRLCGPEWEGEQLEKKERLPDRLGEILPAHVQRSQLLVDIIRQLVDPDPRQRFASASEALEGPTSIYEFQQDLARSRLVVPYCQEIKRWLTDVMNVS